MHEPLLLTEVKGAVVRLLCVSILTTWTVLSASDTTLKPPPLKPGELQAQAAVQKKYGKLPLRFEPNVGQFDSRVRYVARGTGSTVYLTGTEALFALQGQNDRSVVRMKMLGSRQPGEWTALEKQPGISNYFIGNNPKKWHTDVPNYGRVVARGVYPGIDLICYGNAGKLEYDFQVGPGANPRQIELAWEGADSLKLNADGDILLATRLGNIVQKKPRVFQEFNGKEIEIASAYTLKRGNRVQFQLAAYDRRRALRIDPVVLTYSAHLGGTNSDFVSAIAVDSSGAAYAAGYTFSTDFPLQSPYQASARSAFITKLAPGGNTLVYSTYFGGTNTTSPWGIALDSTGAAYLTGMTQASDFPTQSAYQSALKGSLDAFLLKLAPAGNALVYSTYFGGDIDDQAYAIAVDSTGAAYIAGQTRALNFPTQSAYQTCSSSNFDAFVTKFTPAGSGLSYSTCLGGSDADFAYGLAIDASGAAYVTGSTSSTNFPTAAPVQSSFQGGNGDAFVTKLASTGDAVVYSTYLGGSGDETAYRVALDSTGAAYVIGSTTSSNFPTQSAYQASLHGSADIFVTKLTPSGSALAYSTYLGGSDWDHGAGIAVDSAGAAYIAGSSQSTDFPTRLGYYNTNPAVSTAVVAKLSPAGNSLAYSSYLLGYLEPPYTGGMALDARGAVYLAGGSLGDMPVKSAFQSTPKGMGDGFITKFEMNRVPTAVLRDTYNSIRLSNYDSSTLEYGAGIFASDPDAAQNASGDTLTVARDTYGSLWANTFDVVTQTWGSWSYGAGITKGQPAIAVPASGTGYVVARDNWDSYWLTSYTAAGGFGSWQYLAGIFSTDPAICAAPDGSLFVVGRDSWNSLWSGRINASGVFQGWVWGQGIIQGKPSVACGTDGAAYVAVRDSWNSLWIARVVGDTWTWNYGGGIMNGDPLIAADGHGTVYAVIRDSGGVVWYVGRTEGSSGAWTSWVNTGGVLQDFSPAGGLGTLYITGRDSSNKLWWYSTDSSWVSSENTGVAGGPLTAAPR